MGKRSDFKRIERDCYDTPPEAVAPLLPHLRGRCHYWEPCAGNGALVDALASFRAGHCEYMSDVEPRNQFVRKLDALDKNAGNIIVHEIDYIITNPPWTRSILHPMIEHFSDMRPTWLLFDADWMHTKQSAPFMPRLRKVVSVGRVKWIPGSKMTGKDNCAWYLFDKPSTEPTVFIGRAA